MVACAAAPSISPSRIPASNRCAARLISKPLTLMSRDVTSIPVVSAFRARPVGLTDLATSQRLTPHLPSNRNRHTGRLELGNSELRFSSLILVDLSLFLVSLPPHPLPPPHPSRWPPNTTEACLRGKG